MKTLTDMRNARELARCVQKQTALIALNVCDDEIERVCRIEAFPNRAQEVARLIRQRDRFIADLAALGVSLECADVPSVLKVQAS